MRRAVLSFELRCSPLESASDITVCAAAHRAVQADPATVHRPRELLRTAAELGGAELFVCAGLPVGFVIRRRHMRTGSALLRHRRRPRFQFLRWTVMHRYGSVCGDDPGADLVDWCSAREMRWRDGRRAGPTISPAASRGQRNLAPWRWPRSLHERSRPTGSRSPGRPGSVQVAPQTVVVTPARRSPMQRRRRVYRSSEQSARWWHASRPDRWTGPRLEK